MKVISIDVLQEIVSRVGIDGFFLKLIDTMENDFSRWQTFYKSPRHATHYPQGVIELMPCANEEQYAFKYVNGHPKNTASGKLSVVAVGMLADAHTGYPLMLSEMTLLTAFRTAATAALAARYLARPNSRQVAIIGTGAQAEFQLLALKAILPINKVSCFDIDKQAMEKLKDNIGDEFNDFEICDTVVEAVSSADIIVTATADKKNNVLFNLQDIPAGVHINAMGGDCPGKTEFSGDILKQAKLVVEFSEQSLHEGEVQQLDDSVIHAELWEIILGHKVARENATEITFYDSVGFALEDFSILKLVYQLACDMGLGEEVNLIPQLSDPKNLYSLLKP